MQLARSTKYPCLWWCISCWNRKLGWNKSTSYFFKQPKAFRLHHSCESWLNILLISGRGILLLESIWLDVKFAFDP